MMLCSVCGIREAHGKALGGELRWCNEITCMAAARETLRSLRGLEPRENPPRLEAKAPDLVGEN